jgi:TonB-dependent SusC/RagA subfamily outer membrane receptor
LNITDTPLFLVDGKEVSSIENIKPEDIESISVLKDNSAIQLYGEKGKNGVILITTKGDNR